MTIQERPNTVLRITTDRIQAGNAADAYACPVALALMDLGHGGVAVHHGDTELNISGENVFLEHDEALAAWQERLIEGRKVPEIEVTIDWTEHMMSVTSQNREDLVKFQDAPSWLDQESRSSARAHNRIPQDR